MIVTTINKYCVNSISLPERIKGQFWIYESLQTGDERLLNVEGVNGKWIMKSTRRIRILDNDGNTIKNTEISSGSVYVLGKTDGERVFVFTEPVTDDRRTFTKYLVRGDIDISIGRSDSNDICYPVGIVSSHHAVIYSRGGIWYIKDTDSTNGIFVNGVRISEAKLNIGDTVFIMGLKLIVGKNMIALNDPDGCVRVCSRLIPFVSQPVSQSDNEYEYELADKEYFYRSPRFKRDIETATFKIDSPPQSPISEELPWLLVMGSSMAMGMMSLVTLVSAITSKNITSMIMGGSMLLGTVLLPMITKRYEKSHKQKKELQRQKKYREYLDKVSLRINEACRLQEEILNENNVTIQECENRIRYVRRNLWERSFGQNDFLLVRIGNGEGVLDAEFNYAERKFSLNDDNLQDELYTLCESKKTLHNVPVVYSLYEDHISGIIGQRKQVLEFAKGIILQLSAFYSYDEVKFVFLFDKNEEKELEFIKWLPHVWSEGNKFRFIATDSDEVKEISAYFEGIIEERNRINAADMDEVRPYYIFFSFSKTLACRAETLRSVFAKKDKLHISVVSFYDELKNLPKECSIVVELDGGRGKLFNKSDISGSITEFTPDIYPSQNPMELSVILANTSLDTTATKFHLPGMITFLELFGVGSVEHLNILSRWKENDPTKSLQTAVGVDTYGEPFMLDLHEKFHGPHGLVAGMTGSGKSEFIITYILSLAVNYHPEEVAFVLIDYKGGGMAKSFENLPHTVGIMTNLDGSAIKRSLVSIESELKRRQAIFAEASKKVGVSNIDIYKYQRLYREGSVSEPLQHLFIISDEFAELKTQQPEFMTQLVSTARIGRSLGVHLILATQKPSGVVDDQIWSNSKFRVCLKVQEKADSMDMLKRADAAELTDTGRFYLQVGYNELFELGQSAWSGAAYYPSEQVVKEKDNSVVVIDNNGHTIKQVKLEKKRGNDKNAKKQLDVITDYIRNIAEDEKIKIKPLWLEPIPGVILHDQIKKKYNVTTERFVLEPTIGEYDDPAHQKQCVFRLPITREGNVVIYGVAGSGKTTFLNAMLYSLINDYTPDEVNLYILDFASETLRAFSKAPHVGDVMLSYEAEKIGNLFKMLKSELDKRKKLFSDYGGDYSSYIRSSKSTLPSIVVVINNFAAFTEVYEQREDAIAYLSREGTKYGIYFVLTAIGTNAVRMRLIQNFKQLITLRLNSDGDYATVVGKTDGLIPAKFKGRGLVKRDGLYEFQAACLTEENVPFSFIKDTCIRLAKEWSGETAKKIPILPDRVNVEFLADYYDAGKPLNIPIGVESASLNVHRYPFGESYVNIIMSSDMEYRPFVSELVKLANACKINGVVFDIPMLVEASNGTMKVFSSDKQCEDEISKLFLTVRSRNNEYKTELENGNTPKKYEQILVIVTSLSRLKSSLSDEALEKLNLILSKGRKEYSINLIVADKMKSFSATAYESWYSENELASNGLWVGNGFRIQGLLKSNKDSRDQHDTITPEFGYSVIKGNCVKLKLLNDKAEDENDEQ